MFLQGFEVVVGYRKMFAFFKWKKLDNTRSIYWCNETMYGWSHDVLGNDWACFHGVKQEQKLPQEKLVFQSWKGKLVKNVYKSPE